MDLRLNTHQAFWVKALIRDSGPLPRTTSQAHVESYLGKARGMTARTCGVKDAPEEFLSNYHFPKLQHLTEGPS